MDGGCSSLLPAGYCLLLPAGYCLSLSAGYCLSLLLRLGFPLSRLGFPLSPARIPSFPARIPSWLPEGFRWFRQKPGRNWEETGQKPEQERARINEITGKDWRERRPERRHPGSEDGRKDGTRAVQERCTIYTVP